MHFVLPFEILWQIAYISDNLIQTVLYAWCFMLFVLWKLKRVNPLSMHTIIRSLTYKLGMHKFSGSNEKFCASKMLANYLNIVYATSERKKIVWEWNVVNCGKWVGKSCMNGWMVFVSATPKPVSGLLFNLTIFSHIYFYATHLFDRRQYPSLFMSTIVAITMEHGHSTNEWIELISLYTIPFTAIKDMKCLRLRLI